MVDALEMASMYEFLLAFRDIPQPDRILRGTPNVFLLLSAPHQLRDLSILIHLEQALREVANIPELDDRLSASSRKDMAVEGRELYRVQWG